MDNKKSYLPRCIEPGKKLSKMARIPSKITGAILSSGHYSDGRKITFFVNHDHFQQNGSKTVTIIYKLILDHLSDFKVLPRNLIVNCDNCWRENKVFSLYPFSVFCSFYILSVYFVHFLLSVFSSPLSPQCNVNNPQNS